MAQQRDVAVVGVYTTEQVKLSERSSLSLTMEAVNGALDDAGLTIQDIDGWFGNFEGGNLRGSGGAANIAYQFGIPIHYAGAGSGAGALLEAAAMIRAGLLHTAVVQIGMSRANPDGRVAEWTRPTNEFTEWTGSITAGQMGLQMRRHMHEYGTTLEQMGAACATVRNNGHINPEAVMVGRGLFTAQDILDARMVADPFTMLMCSLVTDGGSCFVVTSGERARDLKQDPVWMLGGASETHYTGYFEAPTLVPLNSQAHMIEGFERAGVRHEDVDMVQVYDHFASGIIMEHEVLGFCEVGEGGPFVAENIGLDDDFPTTTDGGNLSYSHPGMPMNFKVIETVRQFRGDVPDMCPDWQHGNHTFDRSICRKVRDPQLSVACNPIVAGFAYALLAKD